MTACGACTMSIDRPAQLKALQLFGMASAWAEWQSEYTSQQKPVMPEVWLDRLIVAEQADRQARRLNYQLKVARFPTHRDLMGFDWQETPLQQARIEQLATAGFMDQAHNLILVGGTGTGKTHLATALAIAAIHQGKRIRFYNAVDLVNQLDKEKQQGKAGTWPSNWHQWMRSSWMSWVTCRSQSQVGHCCSTSLAICTRKRP